MGDSIGRDGVRGPKTTRVRPGPSGGERVPRELYPFDVAVPARLPRTVRPPVAPLVRPGLIEYPPRLGWPYASSRGTVRPPRRIKLSVSLVLLAATVLLFIAYQVVSGFLSMINDLVN